MGYKPQSFLWVSEPLEFLSWRERKTWSQHTLCEPVPFTETSHLTCTFVLHVCLLTSAKLSFGAFVPSLSKMVLKDLVVKCPRQAALPLKAPPTAVRMPSALPEFSQDGGACYQTLPILGEGRAFWVTVCNCSWRRECLFPIRIEITQLFMTETRFSFP